MGTDRDAKARKRFDALPRRIPIEETVGSVDTRAVPDPEGGRDTDRDFLIRYGAL